MVCASSGVPGSCRESRKASTAMTRRLVSVTAEDVAITDDAVIVGGGTVGVEIALDAFAPSRLAR